MLKLNKIHCGDTRELLKQIPDESINCCVTSPPYWGLRDYGTASWEGGNSSCSHIESEIRTGKGLEELSKRYRGGGKKQGQVNAIQYKTVCHECGAVRVDQQMGLEKTPDEFVKSMVEVFREVKRVLRDDGTLWLNLGDSYCANSTGNQGNGKSTLGGGKDTQIEAGKRPDKKVIGLKPKNLVGIPWRVAFALQADGWYLRQDIIWAKPNPMPESVTDRCTKSHEYIFLMSKSERYFYDHEAIKEPAIGGQCPSASSFEREVNEPIRPGQIYQQHRKKRPSKKKGSFNGKTEAMAATGQNAFRAVTDFRNKRSVWTVSTKPYKKAHFATFPPKLIEPCILAGCPKGGVVLDPFSGAGTTAFVASENNRQYIGFELNPDYIEISEVRIKNAEPQLF